MALHPNFPDSPYETLLPEVRWFPAAEELRSTAYEKLLPPLVAKVREEVHDWRGTGYAGASATSRALLAWWFETDHLIEQADGTLTQFRYYFAQREAVETVIWLHDVKKARDKYDLLRLDASGAVSPNMFDEDWPRYVVKMATGAGKTKVLSLLIAWSFFHKLYETDSTLARNFLLIAPNIIVLDRLRADLDGLRIFFNDPVLPDNGHAGRDWRDDFQLTLHIQDDVRVVRPTGNLFLTNIHRVYLGDVPEPSLDDDDLRDYFLAPFGPRPVGKTTDSKTDLGEIVREVEEMAVFNDEAHHIHDNKLAWFKSIQDIHHRMLQKDARLALQLDVTATPRHNNGAIFVQTVSDYPLVEAIYQNVVKHPVLPDPASRLRLQEYQSAIFTEKYADYLQLGVEEWRKSYAEHQALGKKAVLFVMVDDTINCDAVGEHLQRIAPELANAVPGDSHEEQRRNFRSRVGQEQGRTRTPAQAIQRDRHMEVTVQGDRLGADAERGLGRAQRHHHRRAARLCGTEQHPARANAGSRSAPHVLRQRHAETVSVMGTPAFMEFVESIQQEGVTFERVPMGGGAAREDSLVVEVDTQNADKDIDALDIVLPRLARRFHREFKDLAALDPAAFDNARLPLKAFTPEETREILFKTMLDGEHHHTVALDGAGPADYRSVVAFFARQLLKEMRLVGGYELLYPKVKTFLREHLFDASPVNLEDPVVLRNLSEPEVCKLVFDRFKTAINALTVQDSGATHIEDHIRLRDTRPFRTQPRGFLITKKSVFNRMVGEENAGGLELAFASFLEAAPDVQSHAKNYLAVGFKIDYVRANGDLSTYTPDFIVRTADGAVWIVETKGREELDLPQKMARLRQWCVDASAAGYAESGPSYGFVYVDQQGFEQHGPQSFAALATGFRDFQQAP